MTRLSIERALPLVVATALSCAAYACTALSPAGNGGWSDARRQQELARARAMTAPEPPAPEPRQSAAPRSLDLTTALELAARHNRTIAAAKAGVDAAAGDVAVARAALLPVNSVRGGYNWYSDEQTNVVDFTLDGFPDFEPPAITIREKDFATLNAAVRLAIDLSGELRHGLYGSQAAFRAEAARAWATQLAEESAVTDAYYGLLEAERLQEVATYTNALHERQLADASNRYDQGRLTRNEVLVVEVAISSSRQLIRQLDNAIAAARRRLNRTTGLEIDAPTQADDVATRPDLPPLESALAAARSRNPLVSSMLEEVQAADERLTAARRSRFPRFAVTGAYDTTTADTLTPKDYGSVGVAVDFDLVSLRREGEIAKLDAASRRTRLLLDRSAREVEALVRDSHDRVRERLTAIDTASVAVGQAEENLRIRQVQFNEGRATSEDLLDAAELAARQRATLANALYQAHVRRAELQQLMGEPLSGLATFEATAPPAPPSTEARSQDGESDVPTGENNR